MIRHFTTVGATNLAIQSLSGLTGVLVARVLGPESRGDFAVVLLWPGVLAHLGLMGTHLYLARQSAADTDSRNVLHLVGLKVAIRLGLLGIVLLLLLMPWLLPEDRRHLSTAIAVAGLAIPWSMWNILQFHIELGAHRFATFNLARFLFAPFYLGTILIAWVVFGPGVVAFSFSFSAAAALTALAAHAWISRGLEEQANEAGRVQLRRVVRSAFPYGIAVAVYSLSSRLDLIWASQILDGAAIGMYVVALSLATLHASVGSALSTVFFAHAAKDHLSGSAAVWLRRRFAQAVILYVSMGIIMILVLPPLVPFIYGAVFSEAAQLLPILIVATSFQAIGGLLDETLKGLGKPGAGTQARIAGMVALSALALVMIPSFGVKGLTLALVGGTVVEVFLLAIFVRDHFGLRYSELLTIRRSDFNEIVTYTKFLVAELRRQRGSRKD